MPDNPGRGRKRPLKDLVPDDLEAAREWLARTGGVPKDQADELLGGPEIVRELASLGLAHVFPHTRTSGASFQAVSPDLALLGLLAAFSQRASQDHELIMTCVQRLREILSGPSAGSNGDPRHAIRVITDKDEATKLSMDLILSAHHEFIQMENAITDMPITEDVTIRIPAALRGTIRCRTIYDQAMAEHPVAAAAIEQSVADGEEARVVKSVPMKLKQADTSVALLPLSDTASEGAILIRGCAVPILHALMDYFGLLWATGTRIGPGQSPPGFTMSPEHFKIVRLMARGLTIKAIAPRVGLSEESVDRRISQIMDELNPPRRNRFAAGALAYQRGWLNDLEVP